MRSTRAKTSRWYYLRAILGSYRRSIHPATSFTIQVTSYFQQLDYLQYIDFYHDPFIKMFHVKDAEFNPTGKSGVYGGY